jgi:hypothetical protein
MKKVRAVTVDEMILAFVRAEIDSPTERQQYYIDALAQIGRDRATLIDRADLTDARQNADRRFLLGVRGYGRNLALFPGFPMDTSWQLVTVTPAEVKLFKYANHREGWAQVSGSSRLVADGVKNLDQVQNPVYKRNVTGVADRVRRGDRSLQPLIAAQLTGAAEVVLIEGHTRATAYALTDMPDEIEVIIGTSAQMGGWLFF